MSIRKRGKKSWEITIEVGTNAAGKRIREYVSIKGKKSDAERKEREILSRLDKGLPLEDGKTTVSDFMRRWLNNHVAVNTRPKTQQFYEMVNRLYVEPVIGDRVLKNLTPEDIQKVIRGVLIKGLSPTTARRVYATLHSAFESAMRWGLTFRNVCDAVSAPRESEHNITPPDIATSNTLLQKAQETPYGTPIWVLAYTGMRRGEVCALTWEHVDLESKSISVTGSVGRINGKLTISPPKTSFSKRLIQIDSTTVNLLEEHKVRQAEVQSALGAAFGGPNLVFATPTGAILDPDTLTKTWQRICRKQGLTYRLHDLRHAHATVLIEKGTPVNTVQKRLGHSSPSVTLGVYAHVSPIMDRDAADAFEKAMGTGDVGKMSAFEE